MAQEGRELHEDWIEKAFRRQIEQRDKVGNALANMMRSEWGEAITYVFESARETYKDAYLWAEDDKERAHAKGGILCIEAIMAFLKAAAEHHSVPGDELERDSSFHSSSLTVGTGEGDV